VCFPSSLGNETAAALWTTRTAGPAIFPSVVRVSQIEVDPQLLAQTGARLRDAVTVATEVAATRSELSALASAAGCERLTETLNEFLDRWAHGLGCLVGESRTLASMLTDSGRVYVDVESEIARAASPGGRP
jgi:hypothetical protein